MNIVIGSDYCGFELKTKMRPTMEALGHEVIDVGCYDDSLNDFPDITASLTSKILSGDAERGILFCGTAIGGAMAANKVTGIRAAIVHDYYCAHQSVEHNNINVMCIGGKIVSEWPAVDLIEAFLEAQFQSENPEFARRQIQFTEIERVRNK